MEYTSSDYFPFAFHLTRESWERYEVAELVREDGGARSRVDEVRAVREFVDRVNKDRRSHPDGAPPVGSGAAISFGLLTEILRFVADYYCVHQSPGVLKRGIDFVRAQRGDLTVDVTPPAFVHLYPPQTVQLDGTLEGDFLQRLQDGRSNDEVTVREMILLSISASNPALKGFYPLYADDALRHRAPYVPLIISLDSFFQSEPPVDEVGESLFECLRAPMKASPDSLEGQLEFIRIRWAKILPSNLFQRLLVVQGILREETLERGFVQGTSEVLRFGPGAAFGGDQYPEPERFSPDADWMSNVVMIAKTAYVWLDQLSKKYQRHIHRIDQIPDEELDRLRRWGFNALWLIGLWERSSASEDIKRIMGNPEAVASAYSLYDYDIARDLGGEEAYESLRDRARQRGIRLASDMVPNHMGVYSRWVIEHPERFLSLEYPPYPAYQFSGTNLSRDSRVGIYIEDGYWTHRDAAVVFKRVDHWTGSTHYIYHGNDGTSMPWNDTAQLNYLNPETREAVIQTILHVARKFPIIRFDAAMTLAKKHYQRLWFPKPGDAGAIPSRAEHGLNREAFDAQFPEEFWREVVDRVAAEAPDTLLLAEAFWLMEGYFVRTLGMHRVYNSAFMNMLKMEHNADYRATVKNVLEFSPEILKRFVNFMNNPDERTAVEQFGRGDKYFGVALLMVTMPGLPMFGHGQIEGFTEKYGMEYRRAYWDEQVDEGMVQHHETQIFPLMHKRYLFSGVTHFAFYDFHTSDGPVDENVFAYSNRAGDERTVVFYNNAYSTTQGWIKHSSAMNTGRGDEGKLVHRTLGDALNIRAENNVYYTFRDHRDGLEYVRTGNQICDEGLFVHLSAYQYHVFLDFREVYDHDGSWGRLAWELQGRGVQGIDWARRRMDLAPLTHAFRTVCDIGLVNGIAETSAAKAVPKKLWEKVENTLDAFLDQLKARTGDSFDTLSVSAMFRKTLGELRKAYTSRSGGEVHDDHGWSAQSEPTVEPNATAIAYAFALMSSVSTRATHASKSADADALIDELLLEPELFELLIATGRNDWGVQQDIRLLRTMLRYRESEKDLVQRLLGDHTVRTFLMVNYHDGVEYLNKEQLSSLVRWLMAVLKSTEVSGVKKSAAKVNLKAKPKVKAKTKTSKVSKQPTKADESLRDLLLAAEASGYDLEKTVASLNPIA